MSRILTAAILSSLVALAGCGHINPNYGASPPSYGQAPDNRPANRTNGNPNSNGN